MSSIVKIDKKIIGYHVKKNEDKTATVTPIPVVYDRPPETEGKTYKIKPVTLDSALYITINHVKLPDGTMRPIEVFINTKHSDSHQWVMALTRMISAMFRKPGPFEFMLDELEQVYDPQGGYWDGPKMVPSVVAHVGRVIRKHCEEIGAIPKKEVLSKGIQVGLSAKDSGATVHNNVVVDMKSQYQLCSKCKEMAVLMLDGCLTCTACGDGKCG